MIISYSAYGDSKINLVLRLTKCYDHLILDNVSHNCQSET